MTSFNYPFGLPLKTHFVDYVYYNNLILHHEIDRIRDLWSDDGTVKAKLGGSDDIYDDELRKSSVMYLDSTPQNDWIYKRLAGAAIQSNQERYWFDLLGFHEKLQLTKYGEGDFFDWHLDFGAAEISARKLSITVQLSDPDEYEGGDLQFMANQKIVTAPREKGTAIVFPSFMIHRVTPITKGVRQSIVGWVSGPPFR